MLLSKRCSLTLVQTGSVVKFISIDADDDDDDIDDGNDDDDDDIDNEDDDCNCGISLTFGFIQNEDWGDWGQPGNGPPASEPAADWRKAPKSAKSPQNSAPGRSLKTLKSHH